jgi:hypothetical protein
MQLMMTWSNHALQRTAACRHAGCLGSRRAVPPPSLSLFGPVKTLKAL